MNIRTLVGNGILVGIIYCCFYAYSAIWLYECTVSYFRDV